MAAPTPLGKRPSTGMLVALGFCAIVFDGYDLIVYGSAVPALLAYPEWELTAPQTGAIASYALLGMFAGAIVAGMLADRLGRKHTFIGSLTWFSVMMIGVALAPTPELLGLGRFLAGLGFGAIAPVAIALIVESAPASRRNVLNALMLAGFPVGGILAAIAGMTLLEQTGFRVLFALGALPLVTLVPLAVWLLPETPRPAAPRQKRQRQAVGLGGRHAVALALFALANVCGFLLVYGLNTWLPQLMRQAGYPLGSAISFLLVFNLGAVAGGLIGSQLSDRFSGKPVAAGAFALGVAAISLLALPLPQILLYVVIGVAGATSVGTQIVVFGYVAVYFDAHHRGTALGIATGVGRLGAVLGPLVGGYLIASGLELGWNFGAFALVALLGALSSAAVPTRAAPADTPQPGPIATAH